MSRTAEKGSRKKKEKSGGTDPSLPPEARARAAGGQGATEGSGKKGINVPIPRKTPPKEKKNPPEERTKEKSEEVPTDIETASRASKGNGGSKRDKKGKHSGSLFS